MIAFVAGGAAAGLGAGLVALLVIGTGLYDVAASRQHPAIVASAMHATMIRSVHHYAGNVAPPVFTAAEVEAGRRQYDGDCAMCHGKPGQGRAPWVDGLTPTPPYLLDAGRQWTRPQLFWIIKNGVKMTAMPAWGATMTDGQIWNVVAYLDGMEPKAGAQAARRPPAAG